MTIARGRRAMSGEVFSLFTFDFIPSAEVLVNPAWHVGVVVA